MAKNSDSSTSDFSTIYSRMYSEFLTDPPADCIQSILDDMCPDGSFKNIDYSGTGDDSEDPIRISDLAAAYKNPANAYYNNSTVKDRYLAGLKFWVDTDQVSSNWYDRYIAYPTDTRVGVILMKDEIAADSALFNSTVQYLRWAYVQNTERYMTGANGADIVMGAIAASVISENHDEMVDYKREMDALVSLQHNGEGIENDYMFGQHSSHGRQLYIGNYGKDYLIAVLAYMRYCKGTAYATNDATITVLEDHFTRALQWIFYEQNYDPNQDGRMIGTNNTDHFVDIGEHMVALDTPRQADMAVVLGRIRGNDDLVGNRHFWRFDYMIHRRTGYFTSARMTSTRTVGNESGGGQGEGDYYAGSGVNYIICNGGEYSGDFFKNFNDRQFSGTTAEQDTRPLPQPNWGEGGGSTNPFAGGASDGTYGLCGMFLQRRGVSAKKSWFFFDDEFVCLGAGVSQTGGGAAVYSVINQCNLAGAAQYSANGAVHTVDGAVTTTDLEWILHGDIAYLNLDRSAQIALSNANGFFAANVDHGTNPTDGTYAYAVRPNTSSSAAASAAYGAMPVTVEANDGKIQAIRHSGLAMTQVVFYQAGALNLSTGTAITVDWPCVVLYAEHDGDVTIANPYCETDNPGTIHVDISSGGQTSRMTFPMPDGYQAGRCITQNTAGD